MCHYIITNHGHGSGYKCTGRKGGTVLSIEAEHGHLPEQKAMVATLYELMEDLPDPEVFSTKQAAS